MKHLVSSFALLLVLALPAEADDKVSPAVTGGLRWLKNHQSPNGSWDVDGWNKHCQDKKCEGPGTNTGSPHYDVGVSSLALLAFLNHGHTHRVGTFKRTVNRGLRWLKQQQAADGSFAVDPAHGESVYNHAIGTYAVCEAYLITRDPFLKRYAEKAVAWIVKAQNPGLGWKYGMRTGKSDTSITTWMVLALKAAKLAGIDVPSESLSGARAWFERATHSDGRVGYDRPGGGSAFLPSNDGKFDEVPAMTASALIARILAGGRRSDAAVRNGLRHVLASPPTWKKGNTRKANFYYWYHATYGVFQAGSAGQWTKWRDALLEALVTNQRTKTCANGSWDPVGEWCLAGGRVYATAINTLSLEIHLRYERMRARSR